MAFIEGIAVHVHLSGSPDDAALGAMTHDADLMIMQEEFRDLSDLYEVTANPRLGKHEFKRAGFEFDVYAERQNGLVVPVSEVVAASMVKGGLRVACPEHLLVLKAVALADRKGTAKGMKDEDDVARILLCSQGIDPERLGRLSPGMLADLASAAEGDACRRLARNNSHLARTLRDRIRPRLAEVRSCVEARDAGARP